MESNTYPKKALIYVRVSDEQQVDGTSLTFQEEECRRYCEKSGFEVAEVFREEGESAKDLSLNNRKEFLRAIEFCRKNKWKVQAFVVLRVNRFARNTEDHFAVRKILLQYGVSLISVTEPIGNRPAEKLVETVLAATSDYENAIRRQQCTDGMSQKISQGLWPWKPPVGYISNHAKKRGEKKTEPDPTDERTFPLIQRALKAYASGLLASQADVARQLDEWGFGRVRGEKTRPQLVDRLLGKYLKFYAGIIENPFTGTEKRGLHVPMISEDEFHRIQWKRSGKALTVKRDRGNPLFPLRKTVLCASCMRPLTGSCSIGNGGRYPYYHCYFRECPMAGKCIGKARLEQDFATCVAAIAPKEEFLAVYRETITDLWKEKGKSLEAEERQLTTRLSQLSETRKRIFEMREDGSYSRDEFLERKKLIDDEIETVRASMHSSTTPFNLEDVLTYAIGFIQDLAKGWLHLPPQMFARFQKLVFPEGIAYARNFGFRTARLGLIFELNRVFSSGKSPLVDLAGISWNRILEDLEKWQELREALSESNSGSTDFKGGKTA